MTKEDPYESPRANAEPPVQTSRPRNYELKKGRVTLSPPFAVFPARCIFTNSTEDLQYKETMITSLGGRWIRYSLILIMLSLFLANAFSVKLKLPEGAGSLLVMIASVLVVSSSRFVPRKDCLLKFAVSRRGLLKKTLFQVFGFFLVVVEIFGIFILEFPTFVLILIISVALPLLGQFPKPRSGPLIDGRPTVAGLGSSFKKSLRSEPN